MLEFFTKAINEFFLQHHFLIIYTLIIIVAGLFAALISRHKDFQLLLEKLTKLEAKVEKLDDYIRLKFPSDLEIPMMYTRNVKGKQEEENDDLF